MITKFNTYINENYGPFDNKLYSKANGVRNLLNSFGYVCTLVRNIEYEYSIKVYGPHIKKCFDDELFKKVEKMTECKLEFVETGTEDHGQWKGFEYTVYNIILPKDLVRAVKGGLWGLTRESTNSNELLHDGTWTHKKVDGNYYMDLDKIKTAIENGADPDSCNTLNWAVRIHDYEVVKYMLENGADPNYFDSKGVWSTIATGLMDAGDKKPENYIDVYFNIIKLLIDYGADLTQVNFQDNNAMDLLDYRKDAKLRNASMGYHRVGYKCQVMYIKVLNYLGEHIKENTELIPIYKPYFDIIYPDKNYPRDFNSGLWGLTKESWSEEYKKNTAVINREKNDNNFLNFLELFKREDKAPYYIIADKMNFPKQLKDDFAMLYFNYLKSKEHGFDKSVRDRLIKYVTKSVALKLNTDDNAFTDLRDFFETTFGCGLFDKQKNSVYTDMKEAILLASYPHWEMFEGLTVKQTPMKYTMLNLYGIMINNLPSWYNRGKKANLLELK